MASPWNWLPPVPWTCPRCLLTMLTREAGPRCPRCSFAEGTWTRPPTANPARRVAEVSPTSARYAVGFLEADFAAARRQPDLPIRARMLGVIAHVAARWAGLQSMRASRAEQLALRRQLHDAIRELPAEVRPLARIPAEPTARGRRRA
jgi:hypothetical protein